MPLNEYRTALVTGASSGIGAALCRLLGKHGVEVALAARRESQLRNVANEIERSGGKARVCSLDVGDAERVVETLHRLDDEMDGIDLVIANAGVGKTRWSGKIQWHECGPTLAVNVVGATATLTALIPRMVERQRGHLVGVTSLAAYRALPRNAVYSASKAYLSTLLEGLRIDLEGKNITVTEVRPGFVRTPLTEGNPRMPFVMEADEAAREIADAIAAHKALHAFPLPLAMGLRSAAALPGPLYERIIRRVL